MQYEFANNLLTVNVSAIQAVALAVVTYTGGVWIRKKVPFFARYSVPSSVIGGMSVKRHLMVTFKRQLIAPFLLTNKNRSFSL
jgi:Na+/glutamate symporter